MIGLDLDDLAVDGCIIRAPARPHRRPVPVARRKQGLKRSAGVDGDGVPLGLAAADATTHDTRLRQHAAAVARHRVDAFCDELLTGLAPHGTDDNALPACS